MLNLIPKATKQKPIKVVPLKKSRTAAKHDRVFSVIKRALMHARRTTGTKGKG